MMFKSLFSCKSSSPAKKSNPTELSESMEYKPTKLQEPHKYSTVNLNSFLDNLKVVEKTHARKS